MRVLFIPCRAAVIAIALATIAASPIAARSSTRDVSAHRWVARVCAEIVPAVNGAVGDARSWPMVSPSPATVDDVVDRVRVADRAFAGLIAVVRAMRVGMRRAGTPAVSDGEQVVTDTDRVLGEVQAEFRTVRDAIAHFEREFSDDPAAAMDDLRGVLADGLELDLPAVPWPARLEGAFDRSSRCDDVRRAMDEFVDLIRLKTGGSS